MNHCCDGLDKVYLPCLKADIVKNYKDKLAKYNSEVDRLDIPKCSFKKGSDKLMVKVVRHMPSDEMRCECAVSGPCKLQDHTDFQVFGLKIVFLSFLDFNFRYFPYFLLIYIRRSRM